MGLESKCLGLDSSQNPVWDLNPYGWNSNQAKTHGTWFQGLIKLRFMMSHCRKTSVKDKLISKKWIYSDSERNTRHKQECGPSQSANALQNAARLVFIGEAISHANEWENYSNYSGEGVEVSRTWAITHSLVFCPATVMAPLGVSFCLLIEDQGLVLSAIFVPLESNWFMLCPWAMSFFQKLCPAPFPPVTMVWPEEKKH